MTNIEKAIAKAREELSQFNRKYFPNVTAEREAALAVIEAAEKACNDHDLRCEDSNFNLENLLVTICAWARVVLGSTDTDTHSTSIDGGEG